MSRRLAIIFNSNAGSADLRTIDILKELLKKSEKLFAPTSIKSLSQDIKTIIKDGFRYVVIVGGDGTISLVITQFTKILKTYNSNKLPTFAYLRYGTGNATADTIGAIKPDFVDLKSSLLKELDHIRNTGNVVLLGLIKIGDKLAPFGSFHLDAEGLKTYNEIKGLLSIDKFIEKIVTSTSEKMEIVGIDSKFLKIAWSILSRPIKKFHGLFAYTIAIMIMSFLRRVKAPFPNVTIRVGEKSIAHKLSVSGKFIEDPFEAGDILYKGPSSWLAFGRIRHYGYEVIVFPYAATLQDGFFHLRTTKLPAIEIFKRMLKILKNGLEGDPQIEEFACKKVEIEFDRPVLLQMGGDLMGKYKNVKVTSIDVNIIQGSLAASTTPRNGG